MNETALKTVFETCDRAIYAVLKKETFSTNDGNVTTAVKRNDIVSLIKYMNQFEKYIQRKEFYLQRKQAKINLLKWLKEESHKLIETNSYSANSGQNSQSVSYVSSGKLLEAIAILESQTQTGNSVLIWQKG